MNGLASAIRNQLTVAIRSPNSRVFVFRFFCSGCCVRIDQKAHGSYYGIARGVFPPSEIFTESKQARARSGSEWFQNKFSDGNDNDQPDGARNLFRFRKRGAARGQNEFRIANFFSDAEETSHEYDERYLWN
jgi:hypothetical protein